MELDSALQVTTDQLNQQKFDAFIAVSGYESRCIHLASSIDIISIPTKVVLAFNEKKELLYRGLNDKTFNELGFTFYPVSAGDASSICSILEEICENHTKPDLNILIDYSSMPKIWYSELLNFFNTIDCEIENVNIWLSYSPSEYTPSITSISNKYLDPIKPKIKYDKPVALILGLGYEKGRAEELSKQLDAQCTYAFYANPSVDTRYVNELIQNNRSVLRSIKEEQITTYPIFNLNTISELLTELCLKLRMSHQVILVPVGPKPFTLMCFILAARYPDIHTCRVSSVINSNATDRRAHGEILVYKLNYTNEETEY